MDAVLKFKQLYLAINNTLVHGSGASALMTLQRALPPTLHCRVTMPSR